MTSRAFFRTLCLISLSCIPLLGCSDADLDVVRAARLDEAIRRVLAGLGIENNNGCLGHGGNIFSHVSSPHDLPSEDLTMVVLFNSGDNIYDSVKVVQEITRIIAPNNVWPGCRRRSRTRTWKTSRDLRRSTTSLA